MSASDRRENRRERGSSLLEVLIALFVLFVLTIGVLQMFSLAYLQNMGSAARTEMTYRAQQFVENLRYLNYLNKNGLTLPAHTGITFPLTAGTSMTTIDPSASTWWASDAGTNYGRAAVVDTTSSYTVSYQISNGDPGFWRVTVMVTPITTGTKRYLGIGMKHKTLTCAQQIPQ